MTPHPKAKLTAAEVVARVHTWSPDHPHAHDKTWTVDASPTMRHLVFAWVKCSVCGCKTAAAMGWAGKPVCDECWAPIEAAL